MAGLRRFGPHPRWPNLRRALSDRLPSETVVRVDEAVVYASTCHGDQRRPAGEPYLEHLLEALDILVNGPGVTDVDVLLAAVLHDVVEDTDASLSDVHARFGDRVAELVDWVTKPDPGPYETSGEVRRRYLDSLSRAPEEAVYIKLADRVSNVQRLHTLPRPEKRIAYYRETVDHLVPLAERYLWFRNWFAVWRDEYAYLPGPRSLG